ncbi:hypothetical protein EYF80_060827 [Liparis tanakae]|uniref:Uncharacterized protein n=1 Tax=Liparis tanakae TaxID=230148 RepID=A0A4Z2EJI8_9TELE|nr:hypothetical protein EYF80_060827 [Liparis tanakae]
MRPRRRPTVAPPQGHGPVPVQQQGGRVRQPAAGSPGAGRPQPAAALVAHGPRLLLVDGLLVGLQHLLQRQFPRLRALSGGRYPRAPVLRAPAAVAGSGHGRAARSPSFTAGTPGPSRVLRATRVRRRVNVSAPEVPQPERSYHNSVKVTALDASLPVGVFNNKTRSEPRDTGLTTTSSRETSEHQPRTGSTGLGQQVAPRRRPCALRLPVKGHRRKEPQVTVRTDGSLVLWRLCFITLNQRTLNRREATRRRSQRSRWTINRIICSVVLWKQRNDGRTSNVQPCVTHQVQHVSVQLSVYTHTHTHTRTHTQAHTHTHTHRHTHRHTHTHTHRHTQAHRHTHTHTHRHTGTHTLIDYYLIFPP